MCDCAVCEQHRAFERHLENVPEVSKAHFNSLYETLVETQMDLDYNKAVLSGAWPGSIEILERALVRAKAARPTVPATMNTYAGNRALDKPIPGHEGM